MKRLSLVLVAVLILMAFTPITIEDDPTSKADTSEIQNDILEFQCIIAQKQKEAGLLELKAEELFSSNNNIQATKLVNEARTLKFVCLKYEAAIACREAHLDK